MSRKRNLPLTIHYLLLATLLLWQLGCNPPEESAEPDATPVQEEEVEQAEEGHVAAADLPKIPLGLPELEIPEDNPMTAEKIALGKKLYFDTRLSKDGKLSCATCHDPEMAWAEHTAASTGIDGQVGGTNSPTVINSAYAPTQFWDGRVDTLEEQALGPIENPIEMGHDLAVLIPELNEIPEYVEAFQNVFGTEVTSDTLAKAIAAFERTVLSGNSPYDRYADGDETAMSESAIRGLELFEDVGCAGCHKPPLFSRYNYYNAGVGADKDPPDPGRMAVTEREADLGKFRVPMLREVANTAPYFHDGSAATLEEAVTLMVAIRDTELTETGQQDLLAFLEALSGEFPDAED